MVFAIHYTRDPTKLWFLSYALPYDRPKATIAEGPSRTVADFSLLDQDGRMHQLSRYAGSRAVVLFVPGVGCNVARALDIRRAGEAIVIDTRTWQVAYRGRVDDGLGVTGSG